MRIWTRSFKKNINFAPAKVAHQVRPTNYDAHQFDKCFCFLKQLQ